MDTQKANFPSQTMNEPMKQYEVPSAIDRLIRAIDNLQGVHNDLQGRLTSVMIPVDRMPDSAMAEVTSPEPLIQTETADRINNGAKSIESAIAHMQTLLQRLEV